MATESLSLLEFLQRLLTDVQLRDRFAQDPRAALHEHGLDDLSPHDVHDALVLAEDNQTVDFSPDYATAPHAAPWTPPPPIHDATVHYLNRYIADNHVGGVTGAFDQDIDVHSTVAPGAGPVAAGGDVDGSTVTTGHGNQVGSGDVTGAGHVAGHGDPAVTGGGGDSTAFGAGDSTDFGAGDATVRGHVDVGDGGAFASGGRAAVEGADSSPHHAGGRWTDASVDGSYGDHGDHGIAGSHDTDADADTDTDASTHHSHDRSSGATVEDSHDTSVEHHH